MAKLTVYFNNNLISSQLFETDRINIGRDEANDLVINSPEIAPAHALIVTRGNRCMIKQLNTDFPLILNGESIKENVLQQGDTITAGQYSIVYSPTPPAQKTKNSYIPHIANYQVISGANIGKIFHLSGPMTLLGEHGSGIVVISKRKDGYFVSTLEDSGTIKLNNQLLNNQTIKLTHNDVLVVGNTTVQFYLH